VTLADLFGDKQTLIVYGFMFGQQRDRPCLYVYLADEFMGRKDSRHRAVRGFCHARSLADRAADRRQAFARVDEATKLQVYSDNDGDTCDYVSAEDADVPAYNVFTPKSGAIHHFWGGEMGSDMADPGHDQRGALGWEAACRTPFLFDSAAVRPLARHSHRLPRHEQKAPPSERCNRRLITQPTYREATGRTLS
jgi:predicted dithiol-disulfide oxidoreductase (DUF899 family)